MMKIEVSKKEGEGHMPPARFRENQSDDLTGGFIDDDVTGILPSSGLAGVDGSGRYPDEREYDGGDCRPDGESL